MTKQAMKRRSFIKKAGVGTAAAAATATLGAPHVKAQKAIKWRLQTYAGPALAEHVIKPAIDAFNKVANGDMVIELYTADQLVPTGELFRAMQKGTIDAVQSDEDSMAAPVDLSVFGGYYPLALRYSLDVPVLFNQYGLKEIWEEAYSKIDNVTWLSAGSWDPCHFNTTKPIRKLADLKGLRVYTFPSAGRFLSRFGVIPVDLPYEDAEVAVQTGELDGMAWSGITEDYTVGWADVTKYFLTNNISGAWIGSFFANTESWEKVPAHLQQLFRLCAWTARTITASTGTGAARRIFAPRARSWSLLPFPRTSGRRSRPRQSNSGMRSPPTAREAPRLSKSSRITIKS